MALGLAWEARWRGRTAGRRPRWARDIALEFPVTGPRRTVRVPVRADGRMRDITLGACAPLGLNHEGIRRVEFECDSTAAAEIGTMRILEPLRASFYRERYLQRLGSH